MFLTIIVDDTVIMPSRKIAYFRIFWSAVLKYLRKKFNPPFDFWQTGLGLKKVKLCVDLFLNGVIMSNQTLANEIRVFQV